MRILLVVACFLGWMAGTGVAADASGKIIKTLPFFLDLEGRQSLKPSLFERDIYQAQLRSHPKECSTMRFDIHWKASGSTNIQAHLELRGNKDDVALPAKVTQALTADKWLGTWSSITLNKELYQKLGQIMAWRVTLWVDDKQVSEDKSLMW